MRAFSLVFGFFFKEALLCLLSNRPADTCPVSNRSGVKTKDEENVYLAMNYIQYVYS
jgi:hypothetical protein